MEAFRNLHVNNAGCMEMLSLQMVTSPAGCTGPLTKKAFLPFCALAVSAASPTHPAGCPLTGTSAKVGFTLTVA